MIVRIFSFVFELCVISLLTEATGLSHNALEKCTWHECACVSPDVILLYVANISYVLTRVKTVPTVFQLTQNLLNS